MLRDLEKRIQDDATPHIVVQFGVGFEAVIMQLLSLFSHIVNFQWAHLSSPNFGAAIIKLFEGNYLPNGKYFLLIFMQRISIQIAISLTEWQENKIALYVLCSCQINRNGWLDCCQQGSALSENPRRKGLELSFRETMMK